MIFAEWVGKTKWKGKNKTLEMVVETGEIVFIRAANKNVFVCRNGRRSRYFLADISDLEFCNDLDRFTIDE